MDPEAPARRRPRPSAVVALLLTAVLAVTVIAYTAMGPMVCDSCVGAQLETFERNYWTAVTVVVAGIVLAAGLLLAGYLTRRRATTSLPTVLTWLAPAVMAVAGVVAVALIHA